MGLINQRKNSRNLFDLEQVPAIFLIQNVKEQSPRCRFAPSPQGEKGLCCPMG